MPSVAPSTGASAARPDQAMLRRVLESAVRAPSVYNSQPWRWRADSIAGIDLFADRDRHLITIDPDGRDLRLSCGAALQHLVVALAGLGWSAQVDRFPDPENSGHLARVEPVHESPAADVARLAPAIPLRRTDRRRFSSDPVDRDMLDALVAQARDWGAEMHLVAGAAARTRLIETITRSASLQRQQAGYSAELARWTGRYAAAGDGIESTTVAAGIDLPGDVPMRRFTRGALPQSTHSLTHVDASTLMVLSARSDDRLGSLRAGEAAGAVLLAATGLGLATTPLSQPLEVRRTRDWVSEHIVGPQVFPQLLIRVGWADPHSPPLPPARRRAIDHVLQPPATGT
jgi:nitroreductase